MIGTHQITLFIALVLLSLLWRQCYSRTWLHPFIRFIHPLNLAIQLHLHNTLLTPRIHLVNLFYFLHLFHLLFPKYWHRRFNCWSSFGEHIRPRNRLPNFALAAEYNWRRINSFGVCMNLTTNIGMIIRIYCFFMTLVICFLLLPWCPNPAF